MSTKLLAAKDAIEAFKKIGGFRTITHPLQCTERVVSEKSVPFLWEKSLDLWVWEVHFKADRLELPSAIKGYQDNSKREFKATFLKESGTLIQIESLSKNGMPDIRHGSIELAERQLTEEKEKYIDFPSTPPKHSFLQALDTVLTKGFGSPFEAKEISAIYITYSKMSKPPRKVWIVTLRGIPPIEVEGGHGTDIPVWQRNHIRNVIDDETGTCLFATNSPQPI